MRAPCVVRPAKMDDSDAVGSENLCTCEPALAAVTTASLSSDWISSSTVLGAPALSTAPSASLASPSAVAVAAAAAAPVGTSSASGSATRTLTRWPRPCMFLSCWLVPMVRTPPRIMIAMRWHSASASAIECVVSTTERLWRAASRKLHMWRRVTGSIPVDGSSKKTALVEPMSPMATDRRRLLPPLYLPHRASALGANDTALMYFCTTASTSPSGTPRMRASRRRCSRADKNSLSASCCGQMPMYTRAFSRSCCVEWPLTSASPLSMYWPSMCVIECMRDVLPAPLGPSSPRIWSTLTSSDTPFTAANGGRPSFPGYVLRASAMRMTASAPSSAPDTIGGSAASSAAMSAVRAFDAAPPRTLRLRASQ
mmetsp:Transcript_3984/g.14818  ORF Transcript_3984/g.14818 Transcript_3984/m.14818 type:complete len:369 (+) Transcript_3984:146-1252(+)